MSSLTNHKPANYNQHASFVYSSKSVSPVLGLLDAQAGERIVDLGCGTGEVTALIAAAVGDKGHVVGIDSSQTMAKTTCTAELVLADLQDMARREDLAASFDAVFTTAVLHWCKEPEKVLETVKWLLKPGGRFVFEFGGFGNMGAIHQVLRSRGLDPWRYDPWYFPTAAQYERLLSKHGFTFSVESVPRPTPLSSDFKGWLQTFARGTTFASFTDDQAAEMIQEVEEMCRPDCFWQDESGSGWELMYVRLRGVCHR